METLQDDIRKYFFKELTEIGKPKNPSKNQVYKFLDFEETINLLFLLLDYKTDEPTLQRIKQNFYNHAQKIIEFNEKELPTAIEGLATNFEPFLKLIAFLKYAGTELWQGNNEYSEGIIKTTLNNLIIGKINNKYETPSEIPLIDIPEPLLDNHGMQRTILDYLRTDLRNAVHNAKSYSRMELLQNSNLVLSCYLFVIEHNKLFLKRKFVNCYKYLQKLIDDKNYESLDRVYVELFGQEEYKEIDVIGAELLDEIDLLKEISNFNCQEDEEINYDEEIKKEKRIDNLLKISGDTLHFEIIGQAGSGKTTTLYKILYNNAREILKGDNHLKIPFYINANEYRPTNTFLNILTKQENNEWIKHEFDEGNLQILIDGLNEISEKYKQEAYNEIALIIRDYPDNSVILSERKYGFEKKIEIPVFEIKELNEIQIKNFIENYASNYKEEIWARLTESEHMLQLAYNPLLLKMILSVSKNGKIPENKGLLFQLFINTIFQREKSKQEQICSELKIDVLADIAYEIRKQGNVSIPKSKFKDIILKSLKHFNSTIEVNILFEELLYNLVIKISKNEDVSFFHETYQEYFCAIKLKSVFEIIEEVEIDIADRKWFESLLMCSELIKNEKRAISFFEYIFRGQKTNKTPKYIKEFTEEDFNKNINVGCKIAYALRQLKPEIYTIAEKYLANYLILWKYIYFNKNQAPLPIENLFAAIASLNSTKIIKTIFLKNSWAYIWLYSDIEEKNSFHSYLPQEKDHVKREQLRIILESIKKNTPNFSNFYEEIEVAIKEHNYISSIVNNLLLLNKSFLNNIPENQLKSYYQNKLDVNVLIELLRNDINYVFDYDFGKNIKQNSKKVLKVLLKYHFQRELAQKILLNEFKTKQYDGLFKNAIVLMLSNNYLSFVFEAFEFLLDNNEKLFFELKSKLQTIPYNLLTDKLKNSFIVKKEDLIPFEQGTSNVLLVKFIYSSLLNKTCVYYINNFLISIHSKQLINNRENRTIVLVRNKQVIKENIPLQGSLKIISGSNYATLDYFECKISSKGLVVDFKLKNFNEEEWFKDLRIKDNIIKDSNNNNWNFLQWGYSEPVFIKVSFSIITPNIVIKFPENGYLQSQQMNNIKCENPTSYHPDLIANDLNYFEEINTNINDIQYINFIRNIGIIYLFHELIEDVNYGIIQKINYYRNIVTIVEIKRKKAIEVKINFDDINNFQLENIVVIEENKTIHIINEKEENLFKIGYCKSEILNLDIIKKEGFIRKPITQLSKDYFFNFKSCNFIPEKEDSVMFIPTINTSIKYFNEPLALRIKKIELEKCQIVLVNFNKLRNSIFGEAKDIKTNERLHYKLYNIELNKLKNFALNIQVDQIYEYIQLEEAQDGFLKLIKLKFLKSFA